MEHPNATQFREVMAAVANGDLAPLVTLLPEEFVNLNDIGAGHWREVHGRDAFLAFFEQFVTYLEGTFRQDLLEVIGYDDRVVAVVHETGTRQGHPFDNRAIYLVDIDDGMWASLRTMDMDHQKIQQFWDAVGMPAAEQAAVWSTPSVEENAMYVMTARVAIREGRQADAQHKLDDEMVPRSKAMPGFLHGTWYGDEHVGEGVLVFDTREHADQMAARIHAGPDEPIAIEQVRVYALHAEA